MSSVLKSKRGESAVQFLDTARELEIYTIKTCARFPKRYMFLVTKGIVDLSRQIYNDVKAANSIYPTNAAEAQLRKKPHLASKLRFAKSTIATRYCKRVYTAKRRKRAYQKRGI